MISSNRSKNVRLRPAPFCTFFAAWLLALAGVTWSSSNCFAKQPARPPNIVLILADDLGRAHLGCYGQTLIQTPHIDRLAVEGMKFNQCYAGSNVCAPARSTLMTGLHTGHTPVRANGGDRYLYDSDVTLAELLKRAGYACGGFGKWGLGDIDTPGCAVRQGFDEWFGQYNQVHAHFHYPFFLWHNEQKHLLPGNEGGKRGQYAHDEIHQQGLEFIRRHKDRPFFCYLPYTLPHVELVVPDDSQAQYAGKFPKRAVADPRTGYIGADDANAAFAGMVSRLDRGVGEVLAELKRLGLDDNTIVLFSSDNGPQGGAWEAVFVDFFHGAGPFRGMKGNFYEGGIRVPLIARWPGHIKPGAVSEHVCAFWDFLPTLTELARGEIPIETDGISFLPTLLDDGRQAEHEFLYWEHPHAKGIVQAARLGNWKAVRPKPGAALELYDLASDVGERHNQATQQPQVVEKIETLMAAQHTPERKYEVHGPEGRVSDYVR